VKLEIGGSDGTAVSEGGLKVFKFRNERPEDKSILEQVRNEGTAGGGSATDSKLDLHALNLRAILDAWDANEDAETSAPEARKAVAIILAMYESVRKGGASVKVR
jgi:hypothetical protein